MHSSLVCAAEIPIRFNPANYSVKEGVDCNAVIFLEALAGHDFDFTVTVRSRDETAIGEFCIFYIITYCDHSILQLHYLHHIALCLSMLVYLDTVDHSRAHPLTHFYHTFVHANLIILCTELY